MHPGHLEHLCTKSFWDISAPGVSRSTFTCKPFRVSLHPESLECPNTKLPGYHCTSGAFLHPKLSGPRALGASLTEISWGVSHSAPLKHFTPRSSALRAFGTSHDIRSVSCPGLWSIGPPGRAAGRAHRRGPWAPQPSRPRPICFPRLRPIPTATAPRPTNPPPAGPGPSLRVPGVRGGRRIPTGPLGAGPPESQRAPAPTHVGL